jgi:hypothetical protein
VLESEIGDDVVPMSGVAQNGGGYPATARPGEESGVRPLDNGIDSSADDLADFGDERNDACPACLWFPCPRGLYRAKTVVEPV